MRRSVRRWFGHGREAISRRSSDCAAARMRGPVDVTRRREGISYVNPAASPISRAVRRVDYPSTRYIASHFPSEFINPWRRTIEQLPNPNASTSASNSDREVDPTASDTGNTLPMPDAPGIDADDSGRANPDRPDSERESADTDFGQQDPSSDSRNQPVRQP